MRTLLIMFPNVIPAQTGIQQPSRARHSNICAARDEGLDSRLRGNDTNLEKSSLQACVFFFLCMTNFLLSNLSMAAQAIAPPSSIESPNAKRRAELVTLVRQDCGSCHGMTLKGGLGPALLPDALKDKPADSLQATILQGRPGSAMPPWQRFLNEAEAAWIVTQLQKGFPDEK